MASTGAHRPCRARRHRHRGGRHIHRHRDLSRAEQRATRDASGVDAGGATSAADFGGMDGLVAAAKKEGELNVIALPPDWANYGEIIKAFEDKYGIKVELGAARRRQPGRDQRRQAAKGSAPRPTSSTSASRWRWPTRDVRALQGRPSDDIPASLRTPTAPGSTTTAATCRSATTPPRCRAVTSVDDLLKPEYKGKVALNGDPTQAGAAFSGVLMVALCQGGSADDIAPGVEFFRSSRTRATSCRSTRRRRPSSPARRQWSSTGTT